MKGNKPDRDLIREYLLGKLNDRDDLESDTSESILLDDEVSGLAESIEDEIIEDYLEGTLDTSDRIAVDNYFLRSGERRNKLRFIKLMREHFQTRLGRPSDLPLHETPARKADITAKHASARALLGRPSNLVFYAPVAALILVSVLGLAYLSGLRSRQAVLEQELAQERNRASGLAQEASSVKLPLIALTLVSERSRGSGAQMPHVQIRSATQRIVVEIALPNAAGGPYDVSLESKRNASIWRARLLPILSASGDARLVFDVPPRLIESGRYSFLVTSSPPDKGAPSYYDFDVSSTP
jgi:hypothetical protein